MIAPIVTGQHPALHLIATEVPYKTDVSTLIDTMWDTMCHDHGIGLAANQVARMIRVIVVDANGFKQELINPVITKSYGGKSTAKEGCLSVPGKSITKVRDKKIIVEGFDRNWNPVRRKLKGLAAICVQHEIDHLNGITIED